MIRYSRTDENHPKIFINSLSSPTGRNLKSLKRKRTSSERFRMISSLLILPFPYVYCFLQSDSLIWFARVHLSTRTFVHTHWMWCIMGISVVAEGGFHQPRDLESPLRLQYCRWHVKYYFCCHHWDSLRGLDKNDSAAMSSLRGSACIKGRYQRNQLLARQLGTAGTPKDKASTERTNTRCPKSSCWPSRYSSPVFLMEQSCCRVR